MSAESKGNLSGEQQQNVDVHMLPAGMYRIELVTEAGSSNQRIIVQ